MIKKMCLLIYAVTWTFDRNENHRISCLINEGSKDWTLTCGTEHYYEILMRHLHLTSVVITAVLSQWRCLMMQTINCDHKISKYENCNTILPRKNIQLYF